MHRQARRKSVTTLKVPCTEIYSNILKQGLMSTTSPSRDLLLGYLRNRQWKSLLDWADTVTPQLYGSSASYFAEVQLSSLIKKYPFSEAEVEGLNPEAKAIEKFYAAEHRCKRQNLKLRLRRRRFNRYAQQWETARKYIQRVIGETPDIEECVSLSDFSQGASLGVHGSKTNIARKILSESWTCTATARPFANTALWDNIQTRDAILTGSVKCYDREEFNSIVKERVTDVHYNKISFVPKTAKTHRSIAVEPLLNGMIQKGIDQFLRRKLLRFGIDLSDQSKNRLLAKMGSAGGQDPYCTLDLAAASDSISIELVKDLLPPDWFEFLYRIRSTHYLMPNSFLPQRYEKFCSMGNGFCFPLESLIFAAFTYAVNVETSDKPYDFSIYGDDIIIRQSGALFLKELLADAGFRLNTEKSFITGPFRESCGADWYRSRDVRPVVLDTRLTDLRQVMSLHNSFLRSSGTEIFSEEIRSYLRALSKVKYYRPGREPGDTCFSVPLDLAMTSPLVRWQRSSSRWTWKEVMSRAIKDPIDYVDALPYAKWLAFMRGANSKMLLTLRYSSKVRISRVSRPFKDFHHQGECKITTWYDDPFKDFVHLAGRVVKRKDLILST